MLFDIRWLPNEGWLCAVERSWGRVNLMGTKWMLMLSYFHDVGMGAPASGQKFWAVGISYHHPFVWHKKGVVRLPESRQSGS